LCRIDGWVGVVWQAPGMTSTNRIDRQELQDRRLCAAELFGAGVRQAEVARQLGLSRQSVNRWHARFKHAGAQALYSRGRPATRPAHPTRTSNG
jgi:transposase-like protein